MKLRITRATGCWMLMLPILVGSANAGRPLDATGACKGIGGPGQIAVVPGGKLAGRPADAVRSLPELGLRHTQAMQGESAWLKSWNGQVGKNRVFSQGQATVLVMTVCNPSDCRLNRAYVAYDPSSHQYGAKVIEGGPLRDIVPGQGQSTFATHRPLIEDALSCALESDMAKE